MERRERGESHPVHDFLFEYYNLSPGALERWHPGLDVALADAPEYR
ncbi:3-methyladenine DNA glycosylase, partial [Aeromicrobium phragmitis]